MAGTNAHNRRSGQTAANRRLRRRATRLAVQEEEVWFLGTKRLAARDVQARWRRSLERVRELAEPLLDHSLAGVRPHLDAARQG